MKVTIHGGHAPHGKLGAGAVGYVSESLVDRVIKNSTMSWLKTDGNLVVDTTYESGGTQSTVLAGIKKKINAEQNVNANVSIHLNASKLSAKDGKNKGCECWVYPGDKTATEMAKRICNALHALGFTNRGVKESSKLSILKGIKNGGTNVLVEVFFCDDEDDFILYNKLGISPIGKAIAEGIVGHAINEKKADPKPATNYLLRDDKEFGEINYGYVFDPTFYAKTYPDVVKVYGTDGSKLLDHFIMFGMKEARLGNTQFNVAVYKERYMDLVAAYGQDLPKYYKHYCRFGVLEGRKGI